MPASTRNNWWRQNVAPVLSHGGAEGLRALRIAISDAPTEHLAHNARVVLGELLYFDEKDVKGALYELERVCREGPDFVALRAHQIIVTIHVSENHAALAAREAVRLSRLFPHRGVAVTVLALARTTAVLNNQTTLATTLARALARAIRHLESIGNRRELSTIRSYRAEQRERAGDIAGALRLLRAELQASLKLGKDTERVERMRAEIRRLSRKQAFR